MKAQAPRPPAHLPRDSRGRAYVTGEHLSTTLEEQGVSQAELSRRLDVSERTVGHWVYDGLKWASWVAACNQLGLDPSEVS